VPLTGNVMVARDALLDLIDQLRVAIPEEVRAAKRINSEGERILEKAQEEASRILSRAQEQAAFLIEERGLTEAAEAESRRILDEATAAAEEVRRGADGYAAEVLGDLESEVLKVIAGIRRGMDVLDLRRGGAGAAVASTPPVSTSAGAPAGGQPSPIGQATTAAMRRAGMPVYADEEGEAPLAEGEDRDEDIRSLLR
jgi:hypothetical protein